MLPPTTCYFRKDCASHHKKGQQNKATAPDVPQVSIPNNVGTDSSQGLLESRGEVPHPQPAMQSGGREQGTPRPSGSRTKPQYRWGGTKKITCAGARHHPLNMLGAGTVPQQAVGRHWQRKDFVFREIRPQKNPALNSYSTVKVDGFSTRELSSSLLLDRADLWSEKPEWPGQGPRITLLDSWELAQELVVKQDCWGFG